MCGDHGVTVGGTLPLNEPCEPVNFMHEDVSARVLVSLCRLEQGRYQRLTDKVAEFRVVFDAESRCGPKSAPPTSEFGFTLQVLALAENKATATCFRQY